jgi:APA family basic amino acid/polyamine antiporter
MPAKKISLLTGMAIVIANMIGTGAFTSLGFQLRELNQPAVVLTLWVAGGLLALSGAFSYAEVSSQINRSGGEYTFLSRLYHPVVGYLSGWISLTVGFAAPIALSAIACSEYFPYGPTNRPWMGVLLLASITFVHTRSLPVSAGFQNTSTLLKVALVVVLVAIGLVLPGSSGNPFSIGADFFPELGSAAFAVALIYVSYSYSGWNAATYITEEFERPAKSVPVALVGGTFLVTVLYTLLQYVFLRHVPVQDLTGELNVGTLAARRMLGDMAGDLFGLAISLLLISGISAMVWVGSRVTSSIAREHPLWRYFRAGPDGIPKRALWLQFAVSTALLLTGTFEQILIYCGVLLSVSTMLTVFGVFLLRRRNPAAADRQAFRSPLFPLFQVLYLLLSLWMVVFAFRQNTWESVLGMGNLLVGLASYHWSRRLPGAAESRPLP